MWVCASHASAGSLNFGVRVSGSGPGIVGWCMVPSAVLSALDGFARIRSAGFSFRLGVDALYSPPAIDMIDIGRAQRGDRRRDDLLDRFRHVGAVGFAARQPCHALGIDEGVIERAEQEL